MPHLKRIYLLQASLICILLLASLIWRGTSNLSVLSISYSLIFLGALSFFVFFRAQARIQLTPLSILLLAWLGWICLPPALGIVSNNAWFGFFQCSLWVMVFFVFSLSDSPARLWAIMLHAIWVCAVICALYALDQLFIRHAMPSGFFASKNTAAAFLMMAILLLIGEFLASPYEKVPKVASSAFYQRLLALSIFIMMFAMFAALSRGVIIAFVCFVVIELMLIGKHSSRKRLYALLGVLLAAFFSLLLLAQPLIQHRLDMLHHEKSRFIIWEGAWNLWQASPWYGIGIFNFSRYYPAFSLPGDGSTLQYAHNDFLQLLIETGIPGALILTGIMLSLAVSLCTYLRRQSSNPATHIKIVACFAALGACAFHSIVDFNFYVLAMNLVLGCCLGYLHSALKQEGALKTWPVSVSSRLAVSTRIIGLLFLLLISANVLRLTMVHYYSAKADQTIKQQDFTSARTYNTQALAWFDDYEVHSQQADVYLQLANQAQDKDTRQQWAFLVAGEINSALAANPYYARAYFQMALLQTVLLNKQTLAEKFFAAAVKNNPHFCLARITYALYLIDQHQLERAQHLLEAGLHYPITPEYAEIYLNYLAKLRFENGEKQGSGRVTDRLETLDTYGSDYSDLA